MANIVIYTAIFGGYSGVVPQLRFPGVDFVLFSDREIVTNSWEVRVIEPIPGDSVRSNRQVKLLPHRYLPEYQYSVYIDGNFLVKEAIDRWITDLLTEKPLWFFDHNQADDDPRNCVYAELQAILELGRKTGRYKDDIHCMQEQVDFYRSEGFPEQAGLILGGVIVRQHHNPDVVRVMEAWWHEVSNRSRRDQLSFNYVAWKEGADFGYLDGDVRNNRYFQMLGIHKKSYRKKFMKFYLRRLASKLMRW